MFFVMSLESVGIQFKALLIIALLLSSPIMFSHGVMAQEDAGKIAEDVIDSAPPETTGQPDPHPKPPGEGPRPPGIHPEDPISYTNKGEKLPLGDERVELFKLTEEDPEEGVTKIVGTLIISTDPDEKTKQYQCVVTYLLSFAGAPSMMQLVFFVTITPGDDDDTLEKFCHGDGINSDSSITILINKDGTLELEIHDPPTINIIPNDDDDGETY